MNDHCDFRSQTPLEAAYSWTLSCSSALHMTLHFLRREVAFMFECKELLPGRLFPQTDSSEYDKSFPAVKHDVMYYIKERNGHHTHPLADMFFCTKKDELVLVDVTGGNDNVVKEKMERLAQWIRQEQPKVSKFTLHGVVLAPLATRKSMARDQVQVVCGEGAQELLGGLRQIFRWLK